MRTAFYAKANDAAARPVRLGAGVNARRRRWSSHRSAGLLWPWIRRGSGTAIRRLSSGRDDKSVRSPPVAPASRCRAAARSPNQPSTKWSACAWRRSSRCAGPTRAHTSWRRFAHMRSTGICDRGPCRSRFVRPSQPPILGWMGMSLASSRKQRSPHSGAAPHNAVQARGVEQQVDDRHAGPRSTAILQRVKVGPTSVLRPSRFRTTRGQFSESSMRRPSSARRRSS